MVRIQYYKNRNECSFLLMEILLAVTSRRLRFSSCLCLLREGIGYRRLRGRMWRSVSILESIGAFSAVFLRRSCSSNTTLRTEYALPFPC